MRIADSHNHIHFAEIGKDFDHILARARAVGVEHQLLVGIDPDDSRAALNLAIQHEDLYAAIGIHPQMAGQYKNSDVHALAVLAKSSNKIVAVGETGFDLFRTPDTQALQKELFIAHIDLARSLNLPLIIHDRDAHEQTLAVLDEHEGWSLGGVMHCFSGDVDLARTVINKGFYLSIPGVITYKTATILKEVAAFAPLERILIETDAPYLSPTPYRGKRNEPAYLGETLKTLSSIKNITLEEMAAISANNFKYLFLDQRSGKGD